MRISFYHIFPQQSELRDLSPEKASVAGGGSGEVAGCSGGFVAGSGMVLGSRRVLGWLMVMGEVAVGSFRRFRCGGSWGFQCLFCESLLVMPKTALFFKILGTGSGLAGNAPKTVSLPYPPP